MSADLRDVMQHLGERLSDIEVNDMLKEADRDNNGRVFYQGIVTISVTANVGQHFIF
jgi:calmodulin